MIDLETFTELKDKEPFEAFRIYLSDGRSYDVTDPDLFVVMEDRLFMAFPKGTRWTFISFHNITSVEAPIAA